MPLLDRRSAASTGAMSGIYRRLLDRISADPTAVYTQRLSLSGREKAGVAVRALLGSNAGYAASAPGRLVGGGIDVTSVAVIGGGLAGITAALRLPGRRCGGDALEGRPKLGGLTHSFRRGDLDVDNGQHVFLRCCTAYQELLGRLGVADQVTLQDRLDIPVRAPGSTRQARLRRNGLPAPMHLGGSLLRYPLLDTAQRLRFVRAALAMRRLDRTDPAVDARSFGDWLAEHEQDRATIDALWDLVGIATLNAARRRRVARAGGDGVPGRPAHRPRRGRHRLGQRAVAAAARRRRRPRLGNEWRHGVCWGEGGRRRAPRTPVAGGREGRRATGGRRRDGRATGRHGTPGTGGQRAARARATPRSSGHRRS